MIRRRGAARPAADQPAAGPAAGATAPGDAPSAGTAPAATALADTAPGDASGGPGAALPRRRDPWKVAFFGVAIVAILAGTAWALLGSKFLVVRSVEVTGPAAVSRAEVIADAGIRLGTPLVRVNLATVARRVEQVTLVQSAQVRRAWPDKIVISVQERTAVLAVPHGGGYELIDKSGVILR